MRITIAIVIAFIIAAATVGIAQDKGPTAAAAAATAGTTGKVSTGPVSTGGTLSPSPDQSRDLKLAQDEAKLAQIDFQSKINALGAAAQKVIADNHWPAATPFCMDTLAFAPCPSAVTAPSAAAPAAPKVKAGVK
jgi:hypothetical protein